jgi:hypothetical protein
MREAAARLINGNRLGRDVCSRAACRKRSMIERKSNEFQASSLRSSCQPTHGSRQRDAITHVRNREAHRMVAEAMRATSWGA